MTRLADSSRVCDVQIILKPARPHRHGDRGPQPSVSFGFAVSHHEFEKSGRRWCSVTIERCVNPPRQVQKYGPSALPHSPSVRWEQCDNPSPRGSSVRGGSAGASAVPRARACRGRADPTTPPGRTSGSGLRRRGPAARRPLRYLPSVRP